MTYQRLPFRVGVGILVGASILSTCWLSSWQPKAKAQSFYPQQSPISGNIYQNQHTASASDGNPENVMIILDSSYSMSEPIGGNHREDKMIAAKRTVLDVLRNIPPSTRVGLRIYGNSANQFTSCSATQQLVPLGVNNRNQIAAQMIGVHPTGATPISYTLGRSLSEDFPHTIGKKTIILISDGMETCGEDPCNVAVRMAQMGANIKISVVGLGLQDFDAQKQLKCVALATKGQFYTANTAAELANSLNKALAVETKVQGTILAPGAMNMPTMPTEAQAAPATGSLAKSPSSSQSTYQDKELPAVPLKPNKR